MIIQGQAGGIPASKQTSGNPNIAQGLLTELLVSELTPRYYTLLKNGFIHFLNLSAGVATGFTGTSGGTPSLHSTIRQTRAQISSSFRHVSA